MMRILLPTVEDTIDELRYDQSNGRLFSRYDDAEHQTTINGFLHTRLRGAYYPTHRLIWAIETGDRRPPRLAFKNGDRFDTRFTNLEPKAKQTLAEPTREALLERYDYDPAVGRFRDKQTGRDVAYAGAGGYLVISLHGRPLPLARCVWLVEKGYMPHGKLQFLDRDRTNTRIDNLLCRNPQPPIDWNDPAINDAEMRTRQKLAETIGWEEVGAWTPAEVYALT